MIKANAGGNDLFKSKRHTQNPVVISMNCSKAMTVTNYNELASLVSSQKTASLHATRYTSHKTSDSRNETFYGRQSKLPLGGEMTQARRTQQLCSREACPASMDHTPQKQSVKTLKSRMEGQPSPFDIRTEVPAANEYTHAGGFLRNRKQSKNAISFPSAEKTDCNF